jgi:hypothetical protein
MTEEIIEEVTTLDVVDNPDYKINTTEFGVMIVKTEEDGQVWWIPTDNGNPMHEEYLRWVDAGNIAEPYIIPPAQ